MIVTLTGASGSGKSTLAKAILNQLPNASQATSFTTRPRRPGETDSEIHQLDIEQFDQRVARGEFLWVAEVHGNRYATAGNTVLTGLRNELSWLLLDIEPSIVPVIADFAKNYEARHALSCIYVISPSETVLRSRLA